MGHYDESYESTERAHRERAMQTNVHLIEEALPHIRELSRIISSVHIEKEYRTHLEQELRQLRALICYIPSVT